ncbi:hypothetical protein NC652_029785 [Populus alba x Populus x berolinensis]|nr:hypothetical protein NC652_029785 [Populus alba x Populus x berolinensis]
MACVFVGGWWKGRGEVPERCRPYCCMPERIESIWLQGKADQASTCCILKGDTTYN